MGSAVEWVLCLYLCLSVCLCCRRGLLVPCVVIGCGLCAAGGNDSPHCLCLSLSVSVCLCQSVCDCVLVSVPAAVAASAGVRLWDVGLGKRFEEWWVLPLALSTSYTFSSAVLRRIPSGQAGDSPTHPSIHIGSAVALFRHSGGLMGLSPMGYIRVDEGMLRLPF